VVIFSTIFSSLFLAELTDKDALLVLALAARMKPRTVFFAGSTAFIITTLVIVTLGSLLVNVVPILWIRVAGGVIMIAYAGWELKGLAVKKLGEETISNEEERLAKRARIGAHAFLSIVLALATLDLAGDATELLLIVYVARFGNLLLIILAGSLSLIAATAVVTTLGSTLGRILTPRKMRSVSVAIFALIGTYVLATSLLL